MMLIVIVVVRVIVVIIIVIVITMLNDDTDHFCSMVSIFKYFTRTFDDESCLRDMINPLALAWQ